MSSGGLRVGAGRPPAENSQAKDRAARAALKSGKPVVIDDGSWVTLPREGRSGRVPAWPLSKPDRPTVRSKRELLIWSRLWKSPQALAWERVGVDHDQVAFYVRYVVESEELGAPGTVRNLVRQYADGLGLTAAGMRMLKWKIGQPAKEPVPSATPEPAAEQVPVMQRMSTNDRLRLLAGGNGGG